MFKLTETEFTAPMTTTRNETSTDRSVTKPGRLLAAKLRTDQVWLCSRIARCARTYHRLMECACNGYPQEQREKTLERTIAQQVALLPGEHKVTFAGDPRGACVYIMPPDGRSDDIGGRGICALQD